jgi:hypothetical protein
MSEATQKAEEFEGLPSPQEVQVPQPDKDLEIDVIDDRPEEDQKPRRVAIDNVDEEIEGIGDRTKKRIDKLKYNYHEERREKEQANRTRDEAVHFARNIQAENENLKNTVARSEGALLNSLKTRSDTEINAAKAEYKSAYESGDTDKLLTAQEKLQSAYADKNYVENYVPSAPQANLQQAIPQQAIQQQAIQQQAPVNGQQQQLDPKAVEYIRNNNWFEQEGNEDMTALAYGMHSKLVRQGVDPIRDADKYYNEIDNAIRTRFPERFETNTATSRRPSTVVAPANRTGQKQRRVQLTKTQVDLARRLGLTPEQYATQYAKELQRNG